MEEEIALINRAVQSLGEGRRMDRRSFVRGFALCGLMANLLLSGGEAQQR